jgi:histidyl-tRNA synthetase
MEIFTQGKEIANLFADGKSIKEISEILGISEYFVKINLFSIKKEKKEKNNKISLSKNIRKTKNNILEKELVPAIAYNLLKHKSDYFVIDKYLLEITKNLLEYTMELSNSLDSSVIKELESLCRCINFLTSSKVLNCPVVLLAIDHNQTFALFT